MIQPAILGGEPGATAEPSGLRVAFLFGHLHRGGMQRAVSNLTRALPNSIEPFVVYYGTDNPDFEFRAELVDLGVAGSIGTPVPRKLLNFITRIARLRGLVRSQRIDVVVSMGEIANVINSFSGARRRILSVRSAPTASLSDSGAYAPIYSALRRLLYSRADAVVAVSHAISHELRDSYGVPQRLLRVIPNVYDPMVVRSAASEPLPAELSWLEARCFVTAVGTIATHKGQQELVRAIALVRRVVPFLELVLVGDGEGKEAIRTLVSELGLDGAVHLVGFRTNPHAIVARSLALALPSHFEGFPNALVEAMLCGVPVVATDCATGPREILGDSEFGLLVPAMSDAGADAVVEGLASALERLATQPELRERYARLAALRGGEFDAERTVGAWVSLLSGNQRLASATGTKATSE